MRQEETFSNYTGLPTPYEERYARLERSGAFAALLRDVYTWMTLALIITAMAAFYVSKQLDWMQTLAESRLLFWGLLIAELALVIILSARVHKLSFPVAGALFGAYALLNGVTFSFLFLAYDATVITKTFLVTAGTFAGMSLVGYFTRRDLSTLGRLLLMAVIGLIVALLVNVFVGSSLLDLVISYVGVLIFAGLTAYDTQKIKMYLVMYGTERNETTMKIALMGSLSLYLDFINMFIYLLRIFGNRN